MAKLDGLLACYHNCFLTCWFLANLFDGLLASLLYNSLLAFWSPFGLLDCEIPCWFVGFLRYLLVGLLACMLAGLHACLPSGLLTC